MKIIITESQYNNLLSPFIRRRIEIKDFYFLEDYITYEMERKLHYYGRRNNFEDFLNDVISSALNDFIINYKSDHIPMGLDDDDFDEKQNELLDRFWPLFDFLKDKYRDKIYDYFNQNRR
jgi:hypothetical protein